MKNVNEGLIRDWSMKDIVNCFSINGVEIVIIIALKLFFFIFFFKFFEKKLRSFIVLNK